MSLEIHAGITWIIIYPCWDNMDYYYIITWGQIPWRAASLVLSIAGVTVGLNKQLVQGMQKIWNLLACFPTREDSLRTLLSCF